MKKWLLCSLMVCLGLLAGCGGKKSGNSAAAPVDSSTLPALGERIDTLPGGLSAAAPVGWKITPRGANYDFRAIRDNGDSYPTIIIQSESSATVKDLTPANAKDLTAELKLKGNQVRSLGSAETGQKTFVEYFSQGNSDGELMDRRILATVKNGTIYKVELRSYNTLTTKEDIYSWYAVAAGLAWGQDISGSAESTDSTDFPEIGSANAPAADAAPAPADAAPAADAAAPAAQ